MDISAGVFVGLIGLGVAAGGLGALIGIGGGIVMVPVLVIGFGFDVRIAVATSLVAVVATSTAAGASYAREGLTNMRLGLTLETVTTVGGVTGGLVALVVAPSVVAGVFAGVMAVTAILVWRHVDSLEDDRLTAVPPGSVSGREEPGGLAGIYLERTTGRLVTYRAHRLGLGSGISLVAGMLSGLLGVGGGFLKVPAMTLGMGIPTKVAAATSNFTIGVTAISSLLVYMARGFVHPMIATPTTLGIVAGALSGARLSPKLRPVTVRRVLAVVLAVVAVQMGLEAAGVRVGV
jgi:uncharacterized protein